VKTTSSFHDDVEFNTWLNQEVAGYIGEKGVPKYRVVVGEPKVLNPIIGEQPLLFESDSDREFHSSAPVGMPISELVSFFENGKGRDLRFLKFPYPSEIQQSIWEALPVPMESYLKLPVSGVSSILHHVNDKISQWITFRLSGLNSLEFEPEEFQDETVINVFSGGIVNYSPAGINQITINYDEIHSELVRNKVPKEERRELEDILEELESSSSSDKDTLKRRGTEWMKRNGARIVGELAVALGRLFGS